MTQQEKADRIVALLEERYPTALCALNYEGEPWKLLVMGRLSAQCTDYRVNIVCKELFARFPSCEALSQGDLSEIESLVRPCGLYRTKAAQIKEECRMLSEDFSGVLPMDMDALLTFPGVGRKIANLLLGDIYGLPAIVADTHCIRITNLLGLTTSKDPYKVEMQLREKIPPEKSTGFCHRMVLLGREYCIARRPQCIRCPLRPYCPGQTAEKIKTF